MRQIRKTKRTISQAEREERRAAQRRRAHRRSEERFAVAPSSVSDRRRTERRERG